MDVFVSLIWVELVCFVFEGAGGRGKEGDRGGEREIERDRSSGLPNSLNSPQFNSISLKPSFAGRSSHLDLEIISLSV